MSPRRPSSSRRSERRMPSSDTSTRPVSRTGIWTRRPSVVRATTTWRRSRPSNRANLYSGCVTRPRVLLARGAAKSISWERTVNQTSEVRVPMLAMVPRKRNDRRMFPTVALDHCGPGGTSISTSGVRRWVPSPCPRLRRRRCRGKPTSSAPLDASAKTHGHRRKQRQRHSEARQVRLHPMYLA